MGHAVYWIIFSIPSIGILLRDLFSHSSRRSFWIISSAVVIIFVGFRHEVGSDWNSYLNYIAIANGRQFLDALFLTDPAYAAINWFGSNIFGGIYIVNAICAAISVSCLFFFCSKLDLPANALLAAAPYLVIVVFMGYTRQSAAIGLSLIAITAAVENRLVSFVFWTLAAALFHKTAIVITMLLPIFFIYDLSRVRLIILIVLAVVFPLAAYFIFSDRINSLINLYILQGGGVVNSDQELANVTMHSSGAVARLMISFLSASIFFVFISSRINNYRERYVFSIISVAAILLFALSFFRSTIADRLGLYVIALQMYVFSAFPLVFTGRSRMAVTALITVFYAAVLAVWLNFGDNAHNWTPYTWVFG